MKYVLVLAALVGAAVLVAHFVHIGGSSCPTEQVVYNGGC